MINILAIGNSFSQDATTYLHEIAKHGGIETKVVNLYIGGCPLSAHWENAAGDLPRYEYQLNGLATGKNVSIREVLQSDDWDFITMQQASGDSGRIASYFPYVIQLSDYIKQYAPDAKQFIHQTWAYDSDSTHEHFARYDNDRRKMYLQLKDAYEQVSQALRLPLIPCGEVIQALRGLDAFRGQSLCRDGFHLHLVYGRYAAAATWFARVLKGNILENDYLPPGAAPGDHPRLALIRRMVREKCVPPEAGQGKKPDV